VTDSILTKQKLFWLAVGLLRYPRVIAQAVNKIDFELFNQDETYIKIMWLLSKQWFTSNKTAVKETFFYTGLQELVSSGHVQPADNEAIKEVARFAFNKEQVKPDSADENHVILQILESFLYERKIRPALKNLAGVEDLSGGLSELKGIYRGASISKLKIYDPFETEEPRVGGPKRIPWGVDFIDRVTQGGSIPGETTLFMAPSGGGKTLLNVQMAVSAALQGEDIIMLSYEQNVFPSIYNRIYAFATGLPIDTFMGKDLSELHPKVVSVYQGCRERLQGRLHVVDMLDYAETHGGIGGPDDIASIIEDVRSGGNSPRYIGIDWFGPMVNNYMAVNSARSSNKAEVMIRLSDELRKIGSDLEVNIWLFHQLGTQAVTSRTLKVPEATDAFECRSLHHYMDSVVCVSNRDREHNVAICGVPKLRNGDPTGKHLIQMQGSKSRFIMADGFMLTYDSSGVMPVVPQNTGTSTVNMESVSNAFAQMNMD
tara:strand:+ start:489 stop:1943 length:1455 start_codon:yes stop_codon:yes gene_type:complete